jgi:hypothetical protein
LAAVAVVTNKTAADVQTRRGQDAELSRVNSDVSGGKAAGEVILNVTNQD